MWCLYHKKINSSFTLAKVNFIEDGILQVTEYGFGETTHYIDSNDVFEFSESPKELIESVKIYEKFVQHQQEKYGAIQLFQKVY